MTEAGPARTAVVTGASRGFGRALALELADRGWHVIAGVREGSLDHPRIRTVVHDVRDPVDAALFGDGPIDVLVNNAGIGAPAEPIEIADPATILSAVDVNVAGPMRLVQALLPLLEKTPDPLIVNVTSRLGSLSAQAEGRFADRRSSYAYRISKAAQNMLTIALAQELAGQVRCWAVHPGALTTAMASIDADTSPERAAARLAELIERGGPESPSYLSLDGPRLRW
ncbi:NAD(P)-dependent dehydrogenase, short-chain alcohol dehydrogenase family [Actinoplanes derwentensis]|uniref:NAD(P)-dependent dehydrogenase, short-chain alcohol dehydrogenase family n=1 Tax=Actinoplanes derwentensis TaxID=113562 RepID=A0A1H1UNB4_9ACTN|nr:NAD(P)-dependent dehydrogenase, short-chain alcohol dehydrogenase family [Actinoplanes derwentensis]